MQGKGVVLPANSLPKVKIDQKAEYWLKISQIFTEGYETPECEVVYPDGFLKHHQAPNMASLLEKITGTLRGRYGIEELKFASFPKELEEGDIAITGVVFADQ